MKRILSVLLAAVLACSLVSFAMAESCTATVKGFGGDVTVTLTIEGDQLVDVKAEGPNETAGVGSRAIEQLPAKMLEANSIEVDTVTNATVTSKAILAAAAQALQASGAVLTAKAVSNQAEAVVYEDTQTDVVVVGGGISGISAAIELQDAGVPVILLEKTDVLGGAAMMSHSATWAIGTGADVPFKDFTADEIYEFVNANAGPVYNRELFYKLANEGGASYKFLTANGVNFVDTMYCNPQADSRFWAFVADGHGAGMMSALRNSVAAKHIDARLNTTVLSLVQDENGAITGVEVDTQMHPLNAEKQPIENLYAVGELIYGNWFDHSYPMSGTALGGCVSSDRIAAAEIISLLK